jgi:hypothetical protein
MPLTGDSQVNEKAFRIAINSRKLARFYPHDREKSEILEGALAIDKRRRQLDLAPVIHLAVFGRGHAVHDVSELEVVQVTIGPAHDDLNDIVQTFQGVVGRDFDPAPGLGHDVPWVKA